jgi:MHS family proline/betaine transporter-like MFS transporter
MTNAIDIPMAKTLTGLNHYKHFFIENKKQILGASGIYIHSVAIFYTNYFFYPGYMEQHKLIESSTINEVRVIMAIAFLVLFVFFGKYLNKVNEYLWLKVSSVSTALLIFPLHYAMIHFGVYGYSISMTILTVLNVIYLLPIAGLLSGLFERQYRYTGVSLAINVVSSLFGGTAPLMLTFLVSSFNSFFASGIYLLVTATIGYVTANHLNKESKEGIIYVQ